MKRIISVFSILILIMGILNFNKSISASYSFNFVGPTTANNGDSITLTVTANGLTGRVRFTASNATLSDTQKWVEKNSVSITAKITGFPATITATPEELTDNDYNIVSISPKTVTVTEIPKPVVAETPQSQSQTTTPPPTTSSTQSSSNQSSSSSKPSQSTTGTATGKLAPNQESSGEQITEKNDATSSNNYLKSLSVNVGTITPTFDRENTEYRVDNIVEDEIEIQAEAEDERAIVGGIGTIALTGGENIINITVTAQNESVRIYKLIINKKQELTQSDLRLKTLEIKKINEKGEFYDLDIGFDKEKFDYTINVENDILDLDIIPTVEKEGIIVQTIGENNLKEGENDTTITLTNLDDKQERTVYNLKIIKAAKPIVEDYTTENNKNYIAPIIITISIVGLIGLLTYYLTKRYKKIIM